MRYIKAYRDHENQQNNRGVEGLISGKGRGYTGRKDTKILEICHPQEPVIVLDVLQVRLSDELLPIVKSITENEYLTKYNISKSTVWRYIIRWYLGLSTIWAQNGDLSRKVDFQILCGASMGPFNRGVKDTYLERPENRYVVDIALNIMGGVKYLQRLQHLKLQGLGVDLGWESYVPTRQYISVM